jgi:hypothetical protein
MRESLVLLRKTFIVHDSQGDKPGRAPHVVCNADGEMPVEEQSGVMTGTLDWGLLNNRAPTVGTIDMIVSSKSATILYRRTNTPTSASCPSILEDLDMDIFTAKAYSMCQCNVQYETDTLHLFMYRRWCVYPLMVYLSFRITKLYTVQISYK